MIFFEGANKLVLIEQPLADALALHSVVANDTCNMHVEFCNIMLNSATMLT